MIHSLIDGARPVVMLAPAADAAGRNGRWVNVAGASRLAIVAILEQGNAATVALTIEQATSAGGAGAKALANANRIAANQDFDTNDTLSAQTAGVAFTTSAAVKEKAVVFEIDPATLDINNGFKYVRISTGASNAANITAAIGFLMGQRHPGTTAVI